MELDVEINDKRAAESITIIAAGKPVTARSPFTNGTTSVAVRYTGYKDANQ